MSEPGSDEEVPQLILERPRHIDALRLGEAFVRAPEAAHTNGIVNVRSEPAPEDRIAEQRRDVAERRSRDTHEGEEAGLQDIVGTRSPVLRIDALEDR